MTKSNDKTQTAQDATGARNPFGMDPAGIREVQRNAALTGIDGLLSLQTEMHKAFETGLGRIRAETENWARLSNECAAENLSSSFALANKALSTWKDEVGRFGRPSA